MPDHDPVRVDAWLEQHLLGDAELRAALEHAMEESTRQDLPDIAVSAMQGKQLMLLARAVNAWSILEVGTLGGYSAIWLAQGLAPDGRLLTLELEPHHAEVARANLDHAGCADRVEVRIGPALESMHTLIDAEHTGEAGEPPFDLIFIDANKEQLPDYLEAAIELSQPGTMIILDNTVRQGEILEEDSEDERVRGVQRLFKKLSDDRRITATTIQTQGRKGWDGYTLAIVNE